MSNDSEENSATTGTVDRKVYVSGKALVEFYGDDGSVVRSDMVPRNIECVVDYLRGAGPQEVCGLWLVEDETASDPPPEGEPRMRAPLLPDVPDRDGNMQGSSERILVADAITRLLDAMVGSREVLAQFHDLFERASAASDFEGGIVTLVFRGRPAGFAYINSCRDVRASSLGTLYEASASQVAQLKENLRKMAPGIRFSDDEDSPMSRDEPQVLRPDGSPAVSDGRIVTPAEAAREAEEQGLTRIVHLVD